MSLKHLLVLFSTLCLGFTTFAAVIQPNGVTLAPLQQQQFGLPGYNSGVTWWIQPTTMGIIDSNGLYSAPATVGVVFVFAQPAGGSASMTIVHISQASGTASGGTGATAGTGSASGAGSALPSSNNPFSSGSSAGSSPPASGPSAPSSNAPPPSSAGPNQPTNPSGPTGSYPSSPGAVSVVVTPNTAFLQAGQSAGFTPLVDGTANRQVQWSLSPSLGTIVNGIYTAPASIESEAQVTILATSVADPSKTATATVLLGQSPSPNSNVTVSIASGPTMLTAGQSAQFRATVTGTTNTTVSWSVAPNIGTVLNGLYTAPSNISSQQQVTVTAASLADPVKTASIALMLQPETVGISLSPGSATLTGGQSTTFTPLVSGTSNTAVTWSLSPQVGTMNNGAYAAPAIIASQQTVTVTATSTADPTKSASAAVSLQPISVTVAPGSVPLGAGQSATFTASVSGTSNTAVAWSLSPAIGTITNGVYTAPSTVSNAQTITVTATSVVDSTKTATATVALTSSSSGSNPSTITLPVEVIGPNGTTASVSVTIPSGTNLNGPLVLWMQIHGLRTQTQASVQVNNSGWIPINSSTVTLLGNAAAYGGIGGGFSTLQMTMSLPANTVQSGANTISFCFNQTDGRVSGFRVLAFNIQTAGGNQLIPSSTFVQDDPNSWQPPLNDAADIAAGQTLWHTASLTVPIVTGGTQPILAHCSDCHAQDGRDLKYFNYSNNSIEARALFHGLTAQQGTQIASYIRSLSVVNPGRPWNPPYQPGPGLDSQPVSNWAAGAGLDAVLDSDQDMLNAMFPSGFQDSVFAATSNLNQRELPLPVQLPDWNQWLPGTHPMDAFGSTFTTSGYYTIYQALSSTLQVNDPAVYVAQKANFDSWFSAFYGLYNQVGTPIWNNLALWTPANVDAMYSLSQWGLVKTWELMNQFQLEGFAQNIFGPQAEPRAWYSNLPFFVSPHELKMPTSGVAGLRNGSQADYIYLSYIWYNLQLILNDSNGDQSYQYPIDWNYAEGFVLDMGELLSPQAGIQTMWLIKDIQALQQSGPSLWSGSPLAQPSLLVTPEWDDYVWTGVDPTTSAALANGIVKSWVAEVNEFTPQQFYATGWTSSTAVPVPGGNPYDNVLPDWVWYMIPRLTFIGVDPSVVNQVAQWAQTMWPNGNWTADLNATCSAASNQPGAIQCSQ